MLPGFALAAAISSWMLRIGRFGLTTTTLNERATRATGAKARNVS